jgi:hypothetical protein
MGTEPDPTDSRGEVTGGVSGWTAPLAAGSASRATQYTGADATSRLDVRPGAANGEVLGS